MKTRSQQGVALVITLILLSVITFMAVTFLVVSRHEGAQVDVIGQQTSAKFAADAALEEAKAQIVANMLANNNGLNFGLLVSTNFTSYQNFDPTPSAYASLTNVSYNGIASVNDLAQMENNLLYLPRPPVFLTNPTNRNLTNFRFFLDLNRNGAFDTNGAVPESDVSGTPNTYVGDPEWIGILNHPDQRHSSSNLFIARYAFIAVPIGNSLDINYIHNQSKQIATNADGFLRNQGVGSWEINLAGFLNALNTNVWGSNTSSFFYTNGSTTSAGTAFFDAAGILFSRYNGGYYNLSNANTLYTNLMAQTEFGASGSPSVIDTYSAGPLMLGTQPTNYSEYYRSYWPGNNALNPIFTSQDFFNVSPSFSSHLQSVGTQTNLYNQPASSLNSYNRYTYYRMLAQMGTDSSPEPSPYPYTNKINLNYNNLAPVYSSALGNSTASATNFLPWTPLGFFTNAADRMLRTTFPNPVYVSNSTGVPTTNFICITNIPIYPTNCYTPSIQRILQLAANIYDASVYKPAITNTDIDYPSVFRPVFSTSQGIMRVSGYVEVGPAPPVGNDNSFLMPPESLQDLPTNQAAAIPVLAQFVRNATNVYGIPWIIGAKKGFPNFNQYDLQSVSQVQRALDLIYTNGAYVTNVQYRIAITNTVALQAWNSYKASPYANRSYQLSGFNYLRMSLSNETQLLTNTPNNYTNGVTGTPQNPLSWSTNVSIWPASGSKVVIPLQASFVLLSNLVYHPGRAQILSSDTTFDTTGNNQQRLFPQLNMMTTNRVQYVMIDNGINGTNATRRILDYVQLDGMNFTRNLIGEYAPSNVNVADNLYGGCWRTNFNSGMMQGIINQIQIGEYGNSATIGSDTFPSTGWVQDKVSQNSASGAQFNFKAFLTTAPTNGAQTQCPFVAIALGAVSYSYQVNDPLVHYTIGDMTRLTASGNSISNSSFYKQAPMEPYALAQVLSPDYLTGINITGVNNNYGRYAPWAKNTDPNIYNMAVKDPMVTGSDAWQFPTNKYPNIGWLGRVHRGTPWQTVYLKPAPVDPINWAVWSGNAVTNNFRNNYSSSGSGITTPGYPGIYDAVITMPTNDWALLDLFTTAPNDNASRGQLSVNQTNLAAWAAVLDGVITLTNDPVNGVSPWVISPNDTLPSGVSTVQAIVNSINSSRTNFPNTNSGSGSFTSIGQILSVPMLTTNSPYINWTTATNLLSDAVVERIPQQILSLLRVGSPRYVIYAYGQALKPANNSIVQSGTYFGMCTNYQITGEVATRTVLRIENYPIPGVANLNGYHPHAVVESFNVLPPE